MYKIHFKGLDIVSLNYVKCGAWPTKFKFINMKTYL